jgi:hypothetical protein
MSEQRGDGALWAHASVVHANALYAVGRLAQALSLMRRALSVAERLRDGLPGAGLATLLTTALFWLRDPAEAVAPLEHELSQPRLAEAALLRGMMFGWLGLVEALRGNLTVAKGLLGQAQGPSLFEGAIAFYQGEWERADQALAKPSTKHAGGASNKRVVVGLGWRPCAGRWASIQRPRCSCKKTSRSRSRVRTSPLKRMHGSNWP